jgi:hypothetical protein
MKRISIMVLALLTLSSVSNAGGPSIEIEELLIADVAVARDKIIVRVSGTIRLFTRKTKQERSGLYDGKSVTLDAEDVIWSIVKPEASHLDARETLHKNWAEFCKEVKEWNGQTVRGQLWFTEISMKNGRLETIASEYQVVHLVKEQ